MRRNNAWVFLIGTVLTWSVATSAGAQSRSSSENIYVGPLLGISFLNNNVGTKFMIGAQGGYRLFPEMTVGGYFTYNKTSTTVDATVPGGQVASVSSDGSLSIIAAEANYHLDQFFPGLYAGLKAGLGFTSSTASTTIGTNTTVRPGESETDFIIGPAVGYNYPLTQGVTAGGEANLLFLSTEPSFTLFNVLGSLKFWF